MVVVAHGGESMPRMLQFVLQRYAGLRSTCVYELMEVIPTLGKLKPELLIISDRLTVGFGDCQLNGLSILKDIRSDPDLSHLPIVVLCCTEESKARALQFGCGTARVPPSLEEVLAEVRRALGVPAPAQHEDARVLKGNPVS